MSEVIDFVLANPFLLNILAGVASRGVYDVGKTIITHLWKTFRQRPTVFPDTRRVDGIKTSFNESLDRYQKGFPAVVNKPLWNDFFQLFFPDQRVSISRLDETQCEYIAERLYCGATFRSLLLDIDYKEEKIYYPFRMPGLRITTPHCFDLGAILESIYIDNLTIVKVLDNRSGGSPREYVQGIPSMIKQINKYVPPHSVFRNFDIFVLIHTGSVNEESSTLVKDNIRYIQEEYSFIPRIIYYKVDDIDRLLNLSREERRENLVREFKSVKIDRRIGI